MKISRGSLLAGGMLAVALLAGSSTANAQCATNYDGTIRWGINNAGYDKAGVCSSSSSALVDVWVRVLSGSSGNAQALYFLGEDGAAGTASNITTGTPPSGVFIPLNKPAGCFVNADECLWDGTPYALTHIGQFAPTATLVFGLMTSGGSWLVSSNSTTGVQKSMYAFGRQTDGAGNLVYATGGIFADDRTTRMPPSVMSGYVYGFEDNGRGSCGPGGSSTLYRGTAAETGPCFVSSFSGRTFTTGPDRDYQDLIFEVSSSEIAPEPASLVLMASGLAGVAGVAFSRRRRNS